MMLQVGAHGACRCQLLRRLRDLLRFLACVQMQHAYDEYNDRVRATGKSRGHFMVDLCRPGHLTACLRNFQEATGCSDENWESQFGGARCRSCMGFLHR